MTQGTLWLALFLILALVALGGLFLFGWRRRKNRPPKGVAPLPDDDDWN
jgi:LPXTG-motif cell wall-anchored protein